jgi:hypothetical protein
LTGVAAVKHLFGVVGAAAKGGKMTMEQLQPMHVFGYLLDTAQQEAVRGWTKELVTSLASDVAEGRQAMASGKKAGSSGAASSKSAKSSSEPTDLDRAMSLFKV